LKQARQLPAFHSEQESSFFELLPLLLSSCKPADLKSWGELGRRLAMGDYEAAVSFFAAGVDNF
jgi:hypothetical protein